MPKGHYLNKAIGLALLALVPGGLSGAGHLRLIDSIVLPGLAGRLDHLAVDVRGNRLFVSALGANSVAEVSLTNRSVRTLPGFAKPQGILFAPGINRLFIASGNDGLCRILDGSSLSTLNTVPLSPGADLLDYDAAARVLYVGHGGKDAGRDYGEVAIIDAVLGRLRKNIRLPAHPGAILVERNGPRLFVTIPERDQVAVLERASGRLLAMWKVEGQPVSLAEDEAGKRLFVGTRRPPALLELHSASGSLEARSESVGLMDGVFYDGPSGRAYASGGEGFIAIHERGGALVRVATAGGARTSLWVPEWRRLFVAVPAGGEQQAEVRIYAAND